jgi:hypothetical protein
LIGGINIFKMAKLPEVIYKFITITIIAFFSKIEKKNLIIHMETQKALNRQSDSEQTQEAFLFIA